MERPEAPGPRPLRRAGNTNPAQLAPRPWPKVITGLSLGEAGLTFEAFFQEEDQPFHRP
jgi:hypothetical protein